MTPHSLETNTRRRIDNALVIVIIITAVIVILWKQQPPLGAQHAEQCLNHPNCISVIDVDVEQYLHSFEANQALWHAIMLR